MEIYWKAIGAALVTLILSLALERQGKDFSLLLTLAVSGMLAIAAARFLEPVLDFLSRLENLADWNTDILLTLLKILGIGLTGELSASVCSDGGSAALGKGIRLLSNAAIFYLSIPVYSVFLELIQELLMK